MNFETLKKKPIKSSFVVPFTQFDWGDYYSDTDYLDFEEHGVYWNLLRRYYTTGPLENDMRIIQRLTRCPIKKLEMVKAILEDFFHIEDDGCWHHKRCDEEILRAKGTSEVQSRRARKAVKERSRDPQTGMFLSNDNNKKLPAGAGAAPPIKEEDTKDIKYQEYILREIERERQYEEERIKREEQDQKFEEIKNRIRERQRQEN